MEWKFWQTSGMRGLSGPVANALVSQHHLDSHMVERLRVLEKSGQFAGRRVRFVRVIDPTLLEQGKAATLKYDDLQTYVHRQALLFEGHIERDGNVFLTDRRAARSTLRPDPT